MWNELFFLIFDVQHGHATYIKTPNGKHWMIDIGKGEYSDSDTEFSPLRHLHDVYGVTYLDNLIVTHPHHDHIEDIGNLHWTPPSVVTAPRHLAEQDVRSGNKQDQMVEVELYLKLLRDFSNPIQPDNSPTLSQNTGGISVQTFHPNQKARSNLNNHSIIIVLTHAGTKVLIPGDNEPPSWRELLDDPAFVTAITGTDILLAPHHGRESGYCADIFKYFKPRLTIISDARGTETSATSRYYDQSQGMVVSHRSGEPDETRYTVSTRNDGAITVRLGQDYNGNNVYNVTIA